MKKNIKSRNIIVKTAADVFTPIGLVFGMYVILHGHLSPGGGFQGGVLVASAVILIYFGYGREGLSRIFKVDLMKKSEVIGAIAYTVFAFIGILYGLSFCRNVFFNIGNPGELYSSGTIFWMNFSVGFKVLTGVGFLILFMLGLLANTEDTEKE